ncbi:MAG: hypothetical protein JZU67_00525, partial [Burkholderiaceae bacterium]|nr:hypothetical protein [Burkholderiaceae bacterium]
NGATQVTTSGGVITVAVNTSQLSFLNDAWSSLENKLHENMAIATRLKPYLEAVTYTNSGGIDSSGLTALLNSGMASDPAKTLGDILDMSLFTDYELSDA